MIRAILFDLDGTLIDRQSAYSRYVEDFFERQRDIIPRWQRWAAQRRLRRARGLDMRWFAFVAAQRLPALGRPRSWFEADYADRLPRFIEPRPAVNALIDGLTGRYALAVLSNGSGRVQRAKLAHAGLADRFENVFISGEIRVRKPAPASYAIALERLGMQPAEALMVGDHLVEDFTGAHDAGLRTCWINPGGSPLAPEFGFGCEPDFTIDHVTRLPEVLP